MSRDIGDRHVKALEDYLTRLREDRLELPAWRGRVNVTAIAVACGFNREVIYQNPRCRELLREAAETLGMREADPREGSDDLEKVKLERRVTHLERQNSALLVEVSELRRERARVRHIEEMMEAGKRIIL